MNYSDSIQPILIAPCGMDCALCSGYLREKKPCPGCNGSDTNKPNYCVSCRIKHCEEIAAYEPNYCYQCEKFPCARLKHLDKRYRTKYRMSMIANLIAIRATGMANFIAQEQQRWACPNCGGVICVHRESCLYCGQARTE